MGTNWIGLMSRAVKSHLRIALAGAAMFSLMFALAARKDEPRPVVTTVNVGQGDLFDAVWHDAVVPIALKSQSRVESEPVIQIEPVTEKPHILHTTVMQEGLNPEPKYRRRERDICERHGMHKVSIRHGRSWRCRK